MAFTRYHLPTELKKSAEGKPTLANVQVLRLRAVDIAVKALEAGEPEAGDEAQFLERLFSLPDPR
jgi:hypothetical protein